jgi:serine/threonine protein kinase
MGVRYKESEHWYIIGKADAVNKWLLYISVRTSQANELIEQVLPVLVNRKVSFKVLRNQALVHKVNGGDYGYSEAGKVITIYSKNEEEAISLSNEIEMLSNNFKGQVIPGCQRIGELLYVSFNKKVSEGVFLNTVPSPTKVLFSAKKRYKSDNGSFVKWFLIRKGYILECPIRCCIKGIIYKGFRVKVFSSCFIKVGKAYSVDDLYGRNIRDRLLWQVHVLSELASLTSVPRVIDYFDIGDNSCLITEYVKGIEIGKRVKELLGLHHWKDASGVVRSKILSYYLNVLLVVQEVHKSGYVHRDITHANFIINSKDEIYIVDFELSYKCSPDNTMPPYTLGTFGYCAPEQIKQMLPSFKEDIYSLGVLLAYLVSGAQVRFSEDVGFDIVKEILKSVGDDNLTKIVLACIDVNPFNRPSLDGLIESVKRIC